MKTSRIKLTAEFVHEHLICSQCKCLMEVEDSDKYQDIKTRWYICPMCEKEGATVDTKNGYLHFPIEITRGEKVIKTITVKDVK